MVDSTFAVKALDDTIRRALGGAVGGYVDWYLLYKESQTGSTATEYISLYHHTDRDSAKKIAQSGKILQSQAGAQHVDAAFGDGVYLTRIGPDRSEISVAENNYDGNATNRLHKTTVAIEVRVMIQKAEKCQTDRDVYLYKGDLHFKDVQSVSFHVRDRDGGYRTYTLDEFKRQ